MKKYLKEIKKEIIGIILAIIVLSLVLLIFDMKLAGKNDYSYQHVRFIQYLILNFKETHDFFPQFSMNFGLGQSFVTLYYYGMYNPYVVVFQILNFIPINIVMEIIKTVLILSTFIFSYIFFRINSEEPKYAKLAAFLVLFSPVFIPHMFYEISYIYYMPFMLLNLISIHLFVNKNQKTLFIITFALVFYTNFFFAPSVSVASFLYYLFLLYEKKSFTFKNILKYFKYYIVGCLIGMLILLPTLLFQLSGHHESYRHTAYRPLYLFLNNTANISIVVLSGMLGGLFLNKKYKIYSAVLIFIFIFIPFNIFLNTFLYYEEKANIYFLPLVILLFIKVLKTKEAIRKGAVISFLLLLVLILSAPSLFGVSFIVTVLGVGILFGYSLTPKNSQKAFYLLYILIPLGFLGPRETVHDETIPDGIKFVSKEEYNDHNNLTLTNEKTAFTPYREFGNDTYNDISSIYSFSPTQYTSLISPNYSDVLCEQINSCYTFSVMIKNAMLDNMYIKNYYGIGNEGEVNPMFYGVNSSDIYSTEFFSALSPTEKIFAINEGIFVADGLSENEYKTKFNYEKIYSNSNDVTTAGETIYGEIEIPSKYEGQKGAFIISFDVDLPNENSHAVFRVNKQSGRLEKETNNILIPYNGQSESFSYGYVLENEAAVTDFNIYWQSYEDFQKNKMQVIEPENFEVDLNHSYEFDINMEEDGYLATTIPYEKGFTLYVDSQEMEIEKINGTSVGAKLNAGEHHIELVFSIPGFRVGIFLTFAGLGTTLYILVKERKQRKGKNN